MSLGERVMQVIILEGWRVGYEPWLTVTEGKELFWKRLAKPVGLRDGSFLSYALSFLLFYHSVFLFQISEASIYLCVCVYIYIYPVPIMYLGEVNNNREYMCNTILWLQQLAKSSTALHSQQSDRILICSKITIAY